MATFLVFDSGVDGSPAGEWGNFSVSDDLPAGERPREVLISIVPLVPPSPTWNTAGWASIQVLEQGLRLNAKLTAVSLAPTLSGLPFTLLDSDGFVRSSGRLAGFRAVQWSIHDWVGRARVRIYNLN